MSHPIAEAPTGSVSRFSQRLLPLLYQHRLMSTSQLHYLLTPHTKRPEYLLRQLRHLRTMGLVESVDRRASRLGRCELLWHVTAAGCEVVEAGNVVTTRSYRMSTRAAASQLQEHTLAVVDTGITFTKWAEHLGDECGSLDWEPELAHRVREGDNRMGDDAFLVPDAVLRYTRTTQEGRRQMLTFFLEIDRATMQVARLGQKLSTYARYAAYTPLPGRRRQARGGVREAWRDRYPVFPRLLIVLSGAGPAALARRTKDLRALAVVDPRLSQGGLLRAGVTTAELLQTQGPFAPIVTPLLGPPELTNVLLTPFPTT
ncbi:protein involved in plasmid replication-relaxation [Streptomyces sp. CEV 2-1]|uniref:replication-relaxation family protein n=1 Tax=Streptomyces sp. CEV 2-1 TaxID=2485153 RepID=UPI000F48D38C|nr:replication-relaxation family protein [Streptomyces sp. CEV 2-1]ROQ65220.1 protein involved in plasmid replication-relaxation [Streptomyces sp. CEV 2-1]